MLQLARLLKGRTSVKAVSWPCQNHADQLDYLTRVTLRFLSLRLILTGHKNYVCGLLVGLYPSLTVKIGTHKIITVTVLQLEQLDFTVQ